VGNSHLRFWSFMKKILSHDAMTGTSQVAYDDGDGGLVIKTEQDISAALEANKKAYNQVDERARWGDWTHVAHIPLTVFQELNRKGICKGFFVVDQKALKSWLNDPENKHFRVRPGRV
jgi:hypothetical protein